NYPNAEQLVSLHQIAPGAPGLADFESGLHLSPSMYFTYAEHNRAFQSMGVWVTGTASVTGVAEPEQVRTVEVSDGVLQALDVPPAVGRWLSEADQVPRGPQRSEERRVGKEWRALWGAWCHITISLAEIRSV